MGPYQRFSGSLEKRHIFSGNWGEVSFIVWELGSKQKLFKEKYLWQLDKKFIFFREQGD